LGPELFGLWTSAEFFGDMALPVTFAMGLLFKSLMTIKKTNHPHREERIANEYSNKPSRLCGFCVLYNETKI